MARVVHTLILTLVLIACSSAETVSRSVVEIEIGANELNVWLADEPSERRRGLQDIDRLPRGIDGMLFTWPTPVSASFSMEDTSIPLDIWWIDPNGTVIGSAQMEPCPDDSCTKYRSPGAVQWALETPQGAVDIGVGDVLSTTGNS